MFENFVVPLPIEIIGQRDGKILTRTGRFAQDHDPVRIRIRQRPKQNGVNDAEDGGVRPDAERERNDRNCGEGRIFNHLSKSKTEIVHNYSYRSAVIGSTRVARRVGMRQATRDTDAMTSAVPRRMAMCSAGTSNRTPCIALPAS